MSAQTAKRYEEKLVAMRDRLTSKIRTLDEVVLEHGRGTGDLSHLPSHLADCDSEGIETAVLVENTEWQLLNQVDAALARIEQGTFGRCEDCGKKIPAGRLHAIPYASRCVGCEEKHERAT